MLLGGRTTSIAQTTLSTGEIVILAFNGDGTDGFSFMPLVDLATGTKINFTDYGWNGASFNTSEESGAAGGNMITYTAPSLITAGTIIRQDKLNVGGSAFTACADWSYNNGGYNYINAFMTTLAGHDGIIAFQGLPTAPTFLWALQTGSWGGTDDFWNSALPSGLTNGANAIYFPDLTTVAPGNPGTDMTVDDGQYTGPTTAATADEWKTRVATLSNWTAVTDNIPVVTYPTGSYSIISTNNAPTDISLSSSSINENVAENSTVGTLSSTDPDVGNTFTYSLVAGTGDTDNASFNIDGSSLRITNSPNYESKNSYSVRVRTTDQGSRTYEEAFTITINDLNEYAAMTTQAVSSITATSATGNGNITDLGSPNPTAYGVCWNTTGTPTTSDNKVDKGAALATGAFTASLTGLTAGTTYYVRAYATNTVGTSYGEEVTFTTLMNPPGNALAFSGINTYVSTASISNLVITGDITLEAWAKFDVLGSASKIIVMGGLGELEVNNMLYSLTMRADLKLECFMEYGAGNNSGNVTSSLPAPIATGEWHHFAITRTASTKQLTFYVDGKQLGSVQTYTVAPSGGSEGPFLIGADIGSTGYGNSFKGEMDEVRVWNDVRTISEIRDNMGIPLVGTEGNLVSYFNFDHLSGSTLRDLTSNNNHGTLQNMEDVDWVSSESMIYTPTAIAATSITLDSFTVNWEQNYTASKYYLDVSTAGGFTSYVAGYQNKEITGQTTVSQSVTGLQNGTTYYYRIRAFNENTSNTSSSSNTISLTTLDKPTITTASVSTYNDVSATMGGNVTADGGATVTERGVVYSTTDATPTIAEGAIKVVIGSGTGSFSQLVGSLTTGTLYYANAYAINSVGTSYGTATSFTTLKVPTVTTQAVSSILTTSATGNGNITDLGVPNPTAYGVCWNTTGTPTTSDSKVDKGVASVTGSFISSMTGLTAATTYYVRAYATNTAGTSYGTEVSYTTNPLKDPVFTAPSGLFDISNAVYSTKNFNVSGQTSYPYGVTISSDGSKMFVSGIFNSKVIKYNLSTANDVSTASLDQSFVPVSSGARPLDVALSPDGSKLFCLMQYGTVVEFSLSTPYDLSTASTSYTLTVVSTDYGMDFSSDGTKLYIADRDAKTVYQYNLGTGYDLSTTTTPYSKSFSVSSEESYPMDVALSNDGTKMFVIGFGGGKVVEYNLGTAFDVSTAVHTGSSEDFNVRNEELNPYGMAFSNDGSKFYVIGFTSKVHQYNVKASVSFAENGTGNVTDVGANDGDGGATDTGITYSLTSAGDNDLFNINATSGVITFKSAPDYENPGDSNHDNVYLITVTANDGSASNNTSTLDISVTVTDVAENNPPTGSSFSTSSGPRQNVAYTFSTTNFGYSDADSDPLHHIRITAVPVSGTLYLDADNGDDYDSGEELANNALVSKANLDAGNLQYYTTGSASTSFTFDVNDGTDYSALTYTATLNVIAKATVTTTAVTVFNTTSATMGGNVTADGGASVTERGVVYSSTDATPTIAEGATKDTNGTGTGAFSESIGSLSPATTYYIQAYAINSEGTSYGGVQSFTTQKLPQTITFNDLPGKTYGDADFAPDASASSTLTVTYSSSDVDVATIVSNQIHIVGAGSCTIYADQSGNGLYSAAPQESKTLTVAKATLTTTADNQTKEYGEANPALTFQYSGWVNGVETIDTPPSISTTVTGTSGAGTYTDVITLSGGTDNNYSLSLVAGDFEVSKAELTATAVDQTKVYGEANPALTIEYSGWANGIETIDTPPTIVTTVDETSEVDTYANSITLSGGSDNNYTFNLGSGDFEITKATLTVTADDQTKAYGASNPTLTLGYSGWVNEDDEADLDTKPTGTTTVDTDTPIGTYLNSITVSGGVDDNYDFTYVSADFEVTKAILTVTANNQTKVYGAANPTLTFEYSGWVNGVETIDTPPTISTTVDETTAIGNHIGAITVSGAIDDNYLFSYVPGDFEITKSVLTVTANRQVKEYGQANPPLTFSYSGWVNGVEEIDVPPTIYTNVDFVTTSGTYVDAILFFGGSDNNYTFNFVYGTFEIYKATLSVTADQQIKAYGEENPELTYSVSGWKNSDNPDKLTKKPVTSTLIDKNSGAGKYKNAITVSGGYDVNYVFTYTPADFDVTKAQLTVTAESKSKCFDGEVYSGTNDVTYSGFVAGEDETTLEGELNFGGTFAAATNAGTYSIIPEGLTSENYELVYQNGSLVINPLPTATISGDAEICAGSTGMIEVVLTGQAPWSLTYTDGTTSETVNDIYKNPYLISVAIPENTSQTYTITNVTDFNGCSNTAEGSVIIKVKSTTSAGEISGDQLLAPGALPAPIASINPGAGSGSMTYAWESSIDNGLNWEIIPEENSETYAPEIPEQAIWFRRIAISSENNVTCTAVTDPTKISLWPTGVYNQESSENSWSAYAVRNTEIRLKADVGSSAIARLYDIQGRLILVKNLGEGSLNIIPTPNIKTGIYMLFVKENEKIRGFKIPVKE